MVHGFVTERVVSFRVLFTCLRVFYGDGKRGHGVVFSLLFWGLVLHLFEKLYFLYPVVSYGAVQTREQPLFLLCFDFERRIALHRSTFSNNCTREDDHQTVSQEESSTGVVPFKLQWERERVERRR